MDSPQTFTLHRVRPREATTRTPYLHQGSSRATFSTFYGDPQRQRLAGISDYGPGTIQISFPTYDEMLFVLDGEATVTPHGGEPFEMEAGDAIYFVKGTVTDWAIRKTVRDLWCVIADAPLDEEWREWFPAGSE